MGCKTAILINNKDVNLRNTVTFVKIRSYSMSGICFILPNCLFFVLQYRIISGAAVWMGRSSVYYIRFCPLFWFSHLRFWFSYLKVYYNPLFVFFTLGSILGVEAFTQTKWHFVERLNYIPIFLLCGFSNIMSIILWLKSWSYDGMEDTGSNKFTERIFMHVISIVIIATFTYLDGVFIYHKRQKVRKNLLPKANVITFQIQSLTGKLLIKSASFVFSVTWNKPMA